MDSTDTKITYTAIQKRAKQDALDAMPGLPKESTYDAWEDYIADLEAIDAYEIAHESAEWDWCIYYGRAMELCQAVPNGVLDDAESEFNDMGGPDGMGNQFGLYELAAHLAHIIVTREIVNAIEQCREELLELANDKLDQLESV